MKSFKQAIYFLLTILGAPLFLGVAFLLALAVRLKKRQPGLKPRLVWGATPIINNVYWSRAMRLAGFSSETFTNGYYGSINTREDWDVLIQEKYPGLPNFLQYPIAFLESLFRYDVFFLSFDGYFIGLTPLWRFESMLLRLAGKKTVLIPYGGDVFVYRRIRSAAFAHGLMMSYPSGTRRQNHVARRVDHWCAHADFVLPCTVGPEIGRWDALVPSSLHVDTAQWNRSARKSMADGIEETVYVAHAPNHRGFKGTEFIIEAVNRLCSEGLKVELVLIEKMQNAAVRKTLETEIDILVEQLIATGHGLNALEGMASELPVICNLEDDVFMLPFRRWSYFSECPLVSASPENLVDVLRKLVTRPALRSQLGKAGREYVEKYHGLDSAQYLFGEVIEYLYGRRESLINLYHPLLGEYPKRKPKVAHPLTNNRIID